METTNTHLKIPELTLSRAATSQLFKRIDLNTSRRESKTSQAQRLVPQNMTHRSIKRSSENKSLETYFSKIKSALKVDEGSATSKYLLSLRKEFDKMNKDTQIQNKNINIMKKEINFIRSQIDKELKYSSNTQQKIHLIETELEEICLKQKEAKMETKSLKHIIERMKKDELKKKDDCRSKEENLRKKQKILKMKADEVLLGEDNIHKICVTIGKLSEELERDSEKREMKFDDYCKQITEVEDQEKCEQERKEKTYELLSIESNDIMDAKNVILRNVLMTNKMLNKLLDSQISDLLCRNNKLQNSYHLIKTEANIEDPVQLKEKFFSYSLSHQELTSKIHYYEEKQEELMERNKDLKGIEKEKIAKKLEEEKIHSDNLERYEEEKEKLIQEFFEKELLAKKIKSWIHKISENLGLNNMELDYAAKMFEVSAYLSKSSSQLKNKNSCSQKFISPGVRLKKMVKEISQQDEKRRKTEAQEVNETNILENDFISTERKKVKTNIFVVKTQPNKPVKH